MKNAYFKNKSRMLAIIAAIAVLSLGVRLLAEYDFHESALLYIGIPFLTSLILIWIRPADEATTWQKRYRNRVIDAFIIMFGSAVVLFEGFLCVVMFMPIYLFVISLGVLSEVCRERRKKRDSQSLKVHVLPLLIIVSAFEGVSLGLSFDRHEQVSVTRDVSASVAQIKHNLVQPMNLQTMRPWFLALFPMPDDIKAESLMPGDVHEIHFSYHRWFITNVHAGRMLLEISEVGDDRVKTTFVDDTSYIASYMRLKGTEIRLEPLDERRTRVTLSIEFERKLDPYWYFSPLERYGVRKTAEFLITELISRDSR